MKKTLAVLLLVLSCMPPRSDHLLSDPAQAKVDPKLAGRWTGTKDKEPVFFQVSEKEGGLIDVVLVAQDEKKGAVVLTFEGFSTDLGGKHFLNLRPKAAKDEFGESWAVSERYLFVYYTVTGGSLTLSLPDENLMKAAVTGGKLKGRIEKDELIITDETSNLAAFMNKADVTKLFAPFATLKALR
jgi:hypothetical protein